MRMRRSVALAVLLGAIAGLAAGCGAGDVEGFHAQAGGVAGVQHTIGPVTVKTAKVKGLGTILVDSKGFVLYVAAPDRRRRATCKGTCASVWPPLELTGRATAGGSAKASLLGAEPDPGGGKVVTYAHRPLHAYAGDTRPGEASGQGIDSTGGFWYVITPAGRVIKAR